MTETATTTLEGVEVTTMTVESFTGDVAILTDDNGNKNMLPASEFPLDRMSWTRGMRVNVVTINDGVVSFNDPRLIVSLLEGLVPELRSGAVSVVGVARAPGVRTKVAVASSSETVDAVSCCVGRGAGRVHKLIELLGGERVDIIAWHPELAQYALNSLAPAKVERIEIEGDTAIGYAARHQMPAAVGELGLNSSLAGQLVGLTISISAA